MSKVKILLLVVLAILALGGGVIWRLKARPAMPTPIVQNPAQTSTPQEVAKRPTHGQCLGDNEEATYETTDRKKYVGTVTVTIKQKESSTTLFSFPIPDVPIANAHFISLLRCGVYALKSFNWDGRQARALPGFSREVWRYHYDGTGEKIVFLTGETPTGKPDVAGVPGKLYSYPYEFDFSVDPRERYLTLVHGAPSDKDYSLVIKDIATKEDAFVYSLGQFLKEYPGTSPGSFYYGPWAPDGSYLFSGLYDGPAEIAYIRIERDTWKITVASPPPDMPGGVERSQRISTGWLAYADIPSFTGISEVTKQIQDEARKEGTQKNLWLYNIYTKRKVKIASADPAWLYEPNWLSDTELEYLLPPGERHVYRVSVPKIPQ